MYTHRIGSVGLAGGFFVVGCGRRRLGMLLDGVALYCIVLRGVEAAIGGGVFVLFDALNGRQLALFISPFGVFCSLSFSVLLIVINTKKNNDAVQWFSE
jgi:hypothetical protein